MRFAIKRLKRIGRQVRALGPWLLLEALALLWLVRLSLRLLSFNFVRKHVPLFERSGYTLASGREAAVAKAVGAVTAAGRAVPGATCLVLALALHAMLSRRGFRPITCMGVAREADGKLLFHAWVEHQGSVVLGGVTPHDFTPLLRLPGGSN